MGRIRNYTLQFARDSPCARSFADTQRALERRLVDLKRLTRTVLEQYPQHSARCSFDFASVGDALASFRVCMSDQSRKYVKFGVPIVIIVLALSYLAFSGMQESKSYYVTIAELSKMGDSAYSKRLRVAGNVEPGSIKRQGTHVDFVLNEQGRLLNVSYRGSEAPPDTFKDNSQALAEGSYGRDGVFHAKQLQAKCAS